MGLMSSPNPYAPIYISAQLRGAYKKYQLAIPQKAHCKGFQATPLKSVVCMARLRLPHTWQKRASLAHLWSCVSFNCSSCSVALLRAASRRLGSAAVGSSCKSQVGGFRRESFCRCLCKVPLWSSLSSFPLRVECKLARAVCSVAPSRGARQRCACTHGRWLL